VIRTAPLTRKTPLRRKSRKCSQAKDAGGMTPQLRDFALRDIGCIVARLRGLGKIAAAKHHTLTTGMHGNGKRRGEAFTVPLNDWSHQGRVLTEYGWDAATCREKLGPSYAEEAAEFRALYPDDVLLAETEKALAEWRRETIGLTA
jgi:hypothetical protein